MVDLENVQTHQQVKYPITAPMMLLASIFFFWQLIILKDGQTYIADSKISPDKQKYFIYFHFLQGKVQDILRKNMKDLQKRILLSTVSRLQFIFSRPTAEQRMTNVVCLCVRQNKPPPTTTNPHFKMPSTPSCYTTFQNALHSIMLHQPPSFQNTLPSITLTTNIDATKTSCYRIARHNADKHFLLLDCTGIVDESSCPKISEVIQR